MKSLQVEILADVSNHMVIQTPGRKYPGSVIQGDSLHYLTRLAHQIQSLAGDGKLDEVIELTTELEELLRTRFEVYEAALDKHGINRPY